MEKNQGQEPESSGGVKVKLVIPQIIIMLNPTTQKLQITANFKDWDQVENMLIDALRAAYDQRKKGDQSLITIP